MTQVKTRYGFQVTQATRGWVTCPTHISQREILPNQISLVVWGGALIYFQIHGTTVYHVFKMAELYFGLEEVDVTYENLYVLVLVYFK